MAKIEIMDESKPKESISYGMAFIVLFLGFILMVSLPVPVLFFPAMILFTAGVVFLFLEWAKRASKAGRAANILLGIFVAVCAFFSVVQVEGVYGKYRTFIDEYNRQLWENHVGEDVFLLSYQMTALIFVLTISSFLIRWHFKKYLLILLRGVVIASLFVTLFASGWLYGMHSKKMIVGYNEWIRHSREISAQKEKQNRISEKSHNPTDAISDSESKQ
jgi:hypothetical protein